MVFGVEETPIGSQFSLSFARLPPSVDAGLRRADLGCRGADALTVGEFQLPDSPGRNEQGLVGWGCTRPGKRLQTTMERSTHFLAG